MGFFKKLLGRETHNRVQPGANESFGLNLPHTPVPENLPSLAEHAVAEARRDQGVELDYTPESLREVDKILIGYHDRGVVLGSILETVFCLGCYVGEVMRRNGGGAWELSPRPELMGTFPVLRDPTGAVTTPIVKAFKCVQNGEEDSVYALHLLGAYLGSSGEAAWKPLGLPLAPTPQNMSGLAEHAVRVAGEEHGLTLDYSPESVHLVDDILERVHREGMDAPGNMSIVIALGCYAGEVLIRKHGGEWKESTMPMDEGFPSAVVKGSWYFSPVARALKCARNGPKDGLYAYLGTMLQTE